MVEACKGTSLTVPIRSSHFTLIADALFTVIITTTVFVSHFCSWCCLITVRGSVNERCIFNFIVMYSRCSCSCALLLAIFGTLPFCHKSYKCHLFSFLLGSICLWSTLLVKCLTKPVHLDLLLRRWYSVWMANLTQSTRQEFAKTENNNLEQHNEMFPPGHVNWQLNGLSQIYCSSLSGYVDFVKILLLLNLYSRSDHRSNKMKQNIRGNDNLGK